MKKSPPFFSRSFLLITFTFASSARRVNAADAGGEKHVRPDGAAFADDGVAP